MKILYVTLFVVLSDQITKFLVKGGSIPLLNIKHEGMNYGQSIEVIGDFFKFTFVENPGLAFGIEVNEISKLLLSIFSLVASVGIFYYLYKSRHQKLVVRTALALILGGAVGNLIDRTLYGYFYGYAPIFYGSVVDFFNVDFFDFTIFGRTYERWPIFNIADASVTIGVVLLIIFHNSVAESKEVIPADTGDSGVEIIESASADQKDDEVKEENNKSLETSFSDVNNVKNSNREEV